MTQIILPELGEGITKATISYWYFQEGEKVNQGDDLVELTTDKATFNLPSPASGTLAEILSQEGSDVEVGQALGRIEEG
ncbi:MAG: lipoyl domain-containing protein [Candidatus Omnitrophica bacterium]|nr:lipoyl domain-containing protein [Syntrophales bacterium]MDD4910209.1 lipoyl domain-containing protein [Candidatus Omnitrophota bacterium]